MEEDIYKHIQSKEYPSHQIFSDRKKKKKEKKVISGVKKKNLDIKKINKKLKQIVHKLTQLEIQHLQKYFLQQKDRRIDFYSSII